MGMVNDLLQRLRDKVKISLEEAAKRKARQDALNRYFIDVKKHAEYSVALINSPMPVLQRYLDDPNYVWDFKPPAPVPPKPRPI